MMYGMGNSKLLSYLGVIAGDLSLLLNIAVGSIMSKHSTFDDQVKASKQSSVIC